MNHETEKKSSGFPFGTLIGVGTLIVTMIALIPAFLALNKEKPDVYYSYSRQDIKAPVFVDEAKFKTFLKDNNIPSSRIVLQLKNVGNASAEEIKYSMAVPGYIVRYAYTPSKSESPVWVDMPEDRDFGFASTAQSLTQVVKNLATNKVLQFTVGYEPKEKNGNPQIEVYYSGKQAKNVAAISEAPEWNPYRVFILPASILGIGLVITVLWVIVTTLLRRPRIREELAEVLGAFARNLSEIMRPF